MTNAEKFQEIFKKFATEVWAFPEKDFLTWLNAEYKEPTTEIEHWVNIKDCIDGKCDDCNVCNTSTTKNDLGVECIKKSDAINIIQDMHGLARADVISDAVNRIITMTSVTTQEPRWIPVSEKLPNDRDWYMGIFKEPDTGWINPLPFICDYVGRKTKATTKEFWILRGFTDRDYKECDYYYNLECVAWMPLPQAYREVENDTD